MPNDSATNVIYYTPPWTVLQYIVRRTDISILYIHTFISCLEFINTHT